MEDTPKVPQNLQAERAVLGGVINDHAVLDTVRPVLEPRDFVKD